LVTLSLHDALPIWWRAVGSGGAGDVGHGHRNSRSRTCSPSSLRRSWTYRPVLAGVPVPARVPRLVDESEIDAGAAVVVRVSGKRPPLLCSCWGAAQTHRSPQ